MTDDSKEDKETIPSLELTDISKEVTDYEYIEKNIDSIKYLVTPQDTNKIIYTTISHNIDFIKREELHSLAILASIIGSIDTENYSYEDLDNEIYINTGGIGFSTSVYVDAKDNTIFSPRFTIRMKTFEDSFEKGLDLIGEIIKNSKINSKDRIREILLILKSSIESGILQSGHSVVASIVKSYYSNSADYTSKLQGIDFYFYLRDLLKDFDSKWEELCLKLEEIYNKLFNKNDLYISLTGDRKVCEEKINSFKNYIELLNDEKLEKASYEFSPVAKNQGIYTTSNVQYVSKGYDLGLLKEKYRGELSVLANILNISYLHSEIRAKGGAYGAGISFSRAGDIVTYSYRDPNLEKTLNVYDNISKYIEELELTDEELKNFIIGSMNSFDPLISPAQIGDLNLSRTITGLEISDIQESKDQALNTNLDKLKKFAATIDVAMKKNYFAVLGSEEEIKKNSKLFKEIISLK